MLCCSHDLPETDIIHSDTKKIGSQADARKPVFIVLLKIFFCCQAAELFSNNGSSVSGYSVSSYSVNCNFFDCNFFYSYSVNCVSSFSVFCLVTARNHRKTCENSERQE